MKRHILVVAFIVALGGPLLADIPSRRLDGSFSKSPLHNDDYPYTPLDYENLKKNPLGVGILKRVPTGTPEFDDLTAKLQASRTDAVDAELRKKFVKTVQKEFEFTPKEKETVEQYPDEFPQESKLGKRIQVSQVLKLGEKEYDCRQCTFLGKGDWNGDGKDEIFLRHDDYATHAGARSGIMVFTQDGEYVFTKGLQTLFMGWHGVIDVDGDGTVELVFNPGGNDEMGNQRVRPEEYFILACPRTGITLEPYATGGNSPGESRLVPSPSPIEIQSPPSGE